MFDFVEKIIYSFQKIQEKVLNNIAGQNLQCYVGNKTSKRVIGIAASLEVNSKTEKGKAKLKNNVECILKKYDNDPEKLIGFIKRSGTKVYEIPFAKKVLKLVNKEEGLITSTKGLKGLYLNIILPLLSNEKINLSTNLETVLVFEKKSTEDIFIIQQFHKWYAYKLNLPGMDTKAQENLEKFLQPSNDNKIKELSIDEILDLKDAIARDVESINFVIDLAKSTTGSKKALAKMISGGATV